MAKGTARSDFNMVFITFRKAECASAHAIIELMCYSMLCLLATKTLRFMLGFCIFFFVFWSVSSSALSLRRKCGVVVFFLCVLISLLYHFNQCCSVRTLIAKSNMHATNVGSGSEGGTTLSAQLRLTGFAFDLCCCCACNIKYCKVPSVLFAHKCPAVGFACMGFACRQIHINSSWRLFAH